MTYRMLAALIVVFLAAPGRAAADDGSYGSDYDVSVDLSASGAVGLDTFQAPLARYGDWVDVANYGGVWRPRVAVGWRPYYYGRWEWTSEGWFWVSDEPWGWATYHYGRWTYAPYYGWVWVPGYEWAPAWVSWRYSGDVIGWAPLAPGFSIYVTTYPFVDFWWTFVPTVRFVSVPVYTVAYAPSYSRRWFDRTAPAPARPAPRPGGTRPAPAPRSALAWGGPAPRVIEERAGRPVSPVRVVPAPAPGQQRARPGEVSVFRPDRRSAPRREEPGWGPGTAPAPGRGRVAPAPAGRGQGSGVAPGPAPGRGQQDMAPAPAGRGRGPGPAPAPGWSPPERDDRGGGRSNRGDANRPDGRGSSPAWRGNQSSGSAQPGHGQGRSARGHGRRGDERRAAPAPRR